MDPLADVFDGETALRSGKVELGEELDGERERQFLGQGKEHWSDGCKLLFQPGYLKVLKELSLSGQLQLYNIRSVCWRLFLGCLPEDREKWVESVQRSRDHYEQLKKTHITDPHLASASLDIAINNPLSQAEASPWHQFFVDNELRQTIEQDIVRTFPDVLFFKQDEIQQVMRDVLFCYAKEYPDLVYRQGMHELLAPIVFVLNAELRDVDNDPTLAPVLKVVMDPNFIEHDVYTIFSELMEHIQPWYMFSTLEADLHRVRRINSKGMLHDPRTQKPFEMEDLLAPTSAIARKLDMIHHVLLKRADEELYHHLKALSIPAQAYGIRWIRLLFGREFPLPSVLELWDALFADGLSLVDYMCVAMLMHIREVLIEGDYAVCMQHLMQFPTVYEVNYLVQRSLHLRNPSVYTPPRIWAYHPNRMNRMPHRRPPPGPARPSPALQSRASKAKQVLTTTAKQLPRALIRPKVSTPPPRSVTSPPNSLPAPSKPEVKGHVVDQPKEMTYNPKANPMPSTNRLDRLTNQLDTMEAKCQYCGSKLESLLNTLEEEVTEIPNLSPESENTIFLAVAGLKQLRDLLLNKLTFSGEQQQSWEIGSRKNNDDGSSSDSNGSTQQDVPDETPVTDDDAREEHAAVGGASPMYHPLMASDELPATEEDWVHLSTSDSTIQT